MSTDSKLKQAQEDLRRAERAVQEARDELAREAKPKFTDADVVPGARFQRGAAVFVITETHLGYFLNGVKGNIFRAYFGRPETNTEMAAHLTELGCVKTPGKWVFEPEQESLKDGSILWTSAGYKRVVKVLPDGRVNLMDYVDRNAVQSRFLSLEDLVAHLETPIPEYCSYYREKPGA